MTYTIKPGNIAAMCHVIAQDGTTTDCIYLSADKQPVIFGAHDTQIDNSTLPLTVQSAVNAHFAAVFALPVEQRGAYLKTAPTVEVSA